MHEPIQTLSTAYPKRLLHVRVAELSKLRQHEEVDPLHLKQLMEEIRSSGTLKVAIAVDAKTNTILDGEHRFNALKQLGCNKVPVVLVDYDSPEIIVQAWRRGETFSKEDVRTAGFSREKLPPTTTKHMVRICNCLRHISFIEEEVNVPIGELR